MVDAEHDCRDSKACNDVVMMLNSVVCKFTSRRGEAEMVPRRYQTAADLFLHRKHKETFGDMQTHAAGAKLLFMSFVSALLTAAVDHEPRQV